MFRKKNTKERTKHDDKILELVLTGDAVNLRQMVEKKKYSSLLSADEKNRVPIFEAVKCGFSKIAEILIAAEPECTTATDEDGRTALHIAALHGQHECVTLLLKKGALPNTLDVKEQTPLHHAAIAGNVDSIQALLAFQSDTELKDRDGNSVLLCAAKANQRDAVITLLNASANVNAVNKQQKTSLMYACEHGAADLVRTLVQRGARVDHKDTGGRTALSYAKLGAHEACVAALPEDAPLGKMNASPPSPKAVHHQSSVDASAPGADGSDALSPAGDSSSALPPPARRSSVGMGMGGGYTELKDRVEALTQALEKERAAHAAAKAEVSQLKAQLAAFQPDEEEVTFSDEDLDLSENGQKDGSPSRRDSSGPAALRKKIGFFHQENQELRSKLDEASSAVAELDNTKKALDEKNEEAETLKAKVEELEEKLSAIPSTAAVPMVPISVMDQVKQDFKSQIAELEKENAELRANGGAASGSAADVEAIVQVYRKQLLLAVTGQLDDAVKEQLLQIAAQSNRDSDS